MNRRRTLFAGLLLVAVAAAWWASGPRGEPPASADVARPAAGSAAPVSDARVDTAASEIEASPRADAVAAALATVPPAGVDPRGVVDALLAAADAGDRRAACRVAIELVMCRHAEAMLGERWLRGDLDPDAAARMARMDAAVAEVHGRCTAIPASTRDRAADLLRRAALAGEPDAALLYAQGLQMTGHTSRDFIGHPGLDAWRREAEALVWARFRAGDRRAIFLLASASMDDFGLFSGLVADDPVTARAMWLLGSRVSGRGTTPYLRNAVDADQERRATELAARWHREHFGNRIDAREDDMSSLRPPMPWFDELTEPERCTGTVAR